MDDDSSVICAVMDGDKRAWIPLADHEEMRERKALMTECLVNIAREMNRLADRLEAKGSSINDETRPADLGGG